jgi:hypothetical protein
MNVGCTLPHGYVIEVGTPGKPDYRAIQLQGILGSKVPFGMTKNVDNSVMKAWFKKNAKLRYVLDGSIFEIK